MQEMIGDSSMLLEHGIFMVADNMETSARETRYFHMKFYFKICFFEQKWGSQTMKGINTFFKAF